MKKSFILYQDYLEHINFLSDEQAGKLFKAIFLYNQGHDVEMEPIVRMAFSFIKVNLDRDMEKYEAVKERNKINGLKGGRPVKTEEPNETQNNPVGLSGLESVNLETQNNPKKPDTDTDTDTDTDILKKKSIKKKAESTGLVCKTILPVSFRSAPIKSTTLEPHYRDDEEFMAFWEIYPRKRRGDPHAAYKTWQELIISGEVSTEAIMQGCHRYSSSREGSGEYAQGCQRWLNDYGFMKNYTTQGDPHAKFNPVQTIINLRDTGGELKEGIDYTVICGERVLNY